MTCAGPICSEHTREGELRIVTDEEPIVSAGHGCGQQDTYVPQRQGERAHWPGIELVFFEFHICLTASKGTYCRDIQRTILLRNIRCRMSAGAEDPRVSLPSLYNVAARGKLGIVRTDFGGQDVHDICAQKHVARTMFDCLRYCQNDNDCILSRSAPAFMQGPKLETYQAPARAGQRSRRLP